jgi:hypothetical protein
MLSVDPAAHFKMKIHLQNCFTMLFYRSDGEWTGCLEEAHDFGSSARALDFCKELKPGEVQIVFKFGNSRYDMVYPVTEGCREKERENSR